MAKGTKSRTAKTASTAVKKGTHTTQKTKIWNKVAFRLPNTQVQKRNSKVLLRSVRAHNTFDRFAVIKNPLSSESAIKTIEDNNTLVFIVHKKSNKPANNSTRSRLRRLIPLTLQEEKRRLTLLS